MKNFCTELPENYEVKYCIDANSKKVGIIMNLVGTLIIAIVAVICLLLKPINYSEMLDNYGLLIWAVYFFLSYVAYIILHELVHGLVYKIMTKHKLKFGLTFSVAFCGVPDIYVNKKTALLAVLAPFVVFSIVFITAIVLVTNSIAAFILVILFACHFGGCVGDLYVTYILLFKMGKECLMNDTGPKQTFYEKTN